MFSDQSCKIELKQSCREPCVSCFSCVFTLTYQTYCMEYRENLHCESVYFKELHNDQECYWPTISRAGAAVVLSITTITGINKRGLILALPRVYIQCSSQFSPRF